MSDEEITSNALVWLWRTNATCLAYSSALSKNQDLVCSQVNIIFATTNESLKDLHQLDRAGSQHLSGLCWPSLILIDFSSDSNHPVVTLGLGYLWLIVTTQSYFLLTVLSVILEQNWRYKNKKWDGTRGPRLWGQTTVVITGR